MDREKPLQDLSVLVLENEWTLSFQTAELIQQWGGSALCVAMVSEALSVIAGDVDLAILDYRLISNEVSDAVADELERRSIPYLFLTGVPRALLPDRFNHSAVVIKPLYGDELKDALIALIETHSERPT